MMIIIRIAVLALAFLAYAPTAHAGFWDNVQSYFRKPESATPPMIRVLIVHDKPGAVIEVGGRYQLFDPNDHAHISSRLAGKRNFMQAVSGGMKWGEEFPGVHQIAIVPDTQNTSLIVDGVEYRGSLYCYDVGGTISIVNEVYLEDYLESLMVRSFVNPLPEELLSAIAITLRTNALYQAQNPRNKYWDVDAKQVGYEGYAAAEPDSQVSEAIHDTHYMVLSTTGIYEKMVTPIPAQWSGIEIGKYKNEKTVVANISLDQARQLAIQGEHAAQILTKAFPDASIQLTYTLTK